MNKNFKYKAAAGLMACMLIFTGCAANASQASATTGNLTATTATQTYTASSKSEMFTDRDLSGDYDEAEAVKITLSGSTATSTSESGVTIDGSAIKITEEGVYIVSGTLSDGMIIVDADDSAKVQIVLDNASITSETSAALYVKSADKVFVTLAAGTSNTLANGGTFTAIDDSNIDGAVFAKDDITFNGSGSLTVTSPSGHGIVGKDDVKIAGGTITIEAAKHGIQANDSARFAEADVTITAGTDGIHVSDCADEEEGTESDSYFYNADANITITAGDDGIHADAEAISEAGSITVTGSYEGIEALRIDISGGDINVTATDDGLNAAGGSSTGTGTFGSDDWAGGQAGFPGGAFDEGGTDGVIEISGGNIYIQAGGDGVDSNGSVEISGGYTVVCGPTQGDTSVLDYNTTASITGGTFIGTGASGMAETFSSAENQGVIIVSVGNQSAGTNVTLKDASGNTLAEITPELDYAVVYISTPDLETGSTYTLEAGSYSESIDMNNAIYSTVTGGMMGMMDDPMGGGQDMMGGQMDGFEEFGGGMPEMSGNDRMGGPQGSGSGMPGMNGSSGPGGNGGPHS